MRPFVKAPDNLAGLVLAGGQSTRMGADKALVRPERCGGLSLLELAHSRLAELVPDVFVSCARGKKYPGFICIEDEISACGPLGGIFSVLKKLENFQAVLALACDMPLVTRHPLEKLLEIWLSVNPKPGLLAWQSVLSGKIQIFPAIYSASSLPEMYSALRERRFALWNVVPESQRLLLPCEPEMEWMFQSCNTPAELACMDWSKIGNL